MSLPPDASEDESHLSPIPGGRQREFPIGRAMGLVGMWVLALLAAWMHSPRGMVYGVFPLWIAAWAWVATALWSRDWIPWDRAACRKSRIFALMFLISSFLLAMAPMPLSDDIYRYVWEGAVVADGGNPYRSAPEAAELQTLREKLPKIFGKVNNPDLSAIYPPFPQYLFAIIGIFSPSIELIRIFWVFVVIFLIWPVAVLWLRDQGLPTGRAAGLVIHPLVAVEVFLSGHLDVLMMLGGLVLFLGVRRAQIGLAGMGMAMAVLTKLAPAILIPHVMRHLDGWPRRLLFVALVLAVCLGAYAPFLSAGGALFDSLRVYNRVWEYNGSVYRMALGMLSRLDPDGAFCGNLFSNLGLENRLLDAGAFGMQHPNLAGARLLCAVPFGVAYILALMVSMPLEKRWLCVVGAGLLCSPVVHPWYLLGLLPACLCGGRLALLGWYWACAVLFTHSILPGWWEQGVWREAWWPWWLQYGGMALLAAGVRVCRR